jgi:hypothetical protein
MFLNPDTKYMSRVEQATYESFSEVDFCIRRGHKYHAARIQLHPTCQTITPS